MYLLFNNVGKKKKTRNIERLLFSNFSLLIIMIIMHEDCLQNNYHFCFI